MTRVLIIGAGGQGLIVAEILLRARGEAEPIGFLDDNRALEGATVQGLPILGPIAGLDDVPHDAVIVAVGDNHRRAELSGQLERLAERLFTAVHPHASVASDVAVGLGSMISAGAVVAPGVRVGRGVLLNTRCSVDHHSTLGDFAHVGPGATLGADVAIGARTLVGLGASVMSGRRVGADTVVGAGALVSRDVPDGVVVTGVPARIVRPRS